MTFRKIDQGRKEGLDASTAVALMVEYPSAIKRPIMVDGERTFLGFRPDAYEAAFGTKR
jgi:arsenate reductase